MKAKMQGLGVSFCVTLFLQHKKHKKTCISTLLEFDLHGSVTNKGRTSLKTVMCSMHLC